MTRRFHWVLLPILMSAGVLPACSPDKKAALVQSVELAALNEAASAYWDALRWGNVGDAGRYIADADQRLGFLKTHAEGLGFQAVSLYGMQGGAEAQGEYLRQDLKQAGADAGGRGGAGEVAGPAA